MKRLARTCLGVLFLIVGVAGCFLPLLQGWLFLFLGTWCLWPAQALKLRRRLLGKRFRDPIIDLPEWASEGARAGFTTRHFPLFLPSTEELSRSEHHRRIRLELAAALKVPPPARSLSMRQVHGDRVACIESERDFSGRDFLHLDATDGLVTSLAGTALLAMTADCLSVYLRLPGRSGAPSWIGLVHAGWRGTRASITAKAARLMLERSGRPASELEVILGPRIGARRYVVGKEFLDHFPGGSVRERAGKLCFDLAAENVRQLAALGVRRSRIVDTGVCTVEENPHFYSFRLEGDRAGRMVSYIFRT